ncbi:MAG: hypothetical protein EOO65_03260 [Methanosarcinales archaeon]|nr:MAG: hypothetical protein EOO65_03260 [Methanosarcinales archaeon]
MDLTDSALGLVDRQLETGLLTVLAQRCSKDGHQPAKTEINSASCICKATTNAFCWNLALDVIFKQYPSAVEDAVRV